MRYRGAIVVLFATGACVACSLIYRPSDYFDPTDRLTTIGVVPGGAKAIVLTRSSVIYTTSTGIYAVPKAGGDALTLRAFAFGAVAAIASNDTDLVAWCGAMGIEAWRPGGGVIAVDANATDCASLDVRGASIAAAVTVLDPNDAAIYQASLYRGPSFAVDPKGGTPMPLLSATASDHLVSLSTEDSVYYLAGSVIGRQPRPGDKTSIFDPYCGLGATVGSAHDFRVVALEDAGLLWLYRGAATAGFGTNDGCCTVADGGCPKANDTFRQPYRAVVLRDPYVYVLLESELRRGLLADAIGGRRGGLATTLIRGGLAGIVGSLAIDDTDAYFGAGDRIQKLAL